MPVAPPTTARTGQRARPVEVTAQSAADRRCDVCPHPVVEHDGIALRFCRATAAGALARGCVCPPASLQRTRCGVQPNATQRSQT
jgi:hypothetical protein